MTTTEIIYTVCISFLLICVIVLLVCLLFTINRLDDKNIFFTTKKDYLRDISKSLEKISKNQDTCDSHLYYLDRMVVREELENNK